MPGRDVLTQGAGRGGLRMEVRGRVSEVEKRGVENLGRRTWGGELDVGT